MLCATTTASHAGIITINSSNNRVSANDVNFSGSDTQTEGSTAIPTNTLISATEGASTISTAISYNIVNGQTILRFDFDQTRSGRFDSYAQAILDFMFFTVDSDTTYSLSGEYALSDSSGTNQVEFASHLFEFHNGNTQALFHNTQISRSTPGEFFTLGEAGGDHANVLTGSLTGVLRPGRLYRFNYFAELQANANDNGASGTGFVQLTLGDPVTTPVPEPSSLALFGCGLCIVALVAFNRRRRPLDARPSVA